jgi:eukaryotic translation initiation factor 2C
MGSPLLNVSTATTAFYEPMSVDKFLTDFRRVIWSKYSRAAKDALIGVKVKIKSQNDKIKAIKEFGWKPREQTFWRADGDEPTVLDHIKEKKQLAKDHPALYQKVLTSDFPCANLGTLQKKEWLPVEILDIVEHQPFKIALSAQATFNIINFARQEPGINRQTIVREGRELLGITAQSNTSSALSKANIRIEEALLEVPARREKSLTVNYANNRTPDNKNERGRWNLAKNKFISTTIRFPGRVLFLFPKDIHDNVSSDVMMEIGQGLINQMKATGIQLEGGAAYNVLQTDIDAVKTDESVTQIRNSYQVWSDLQIAFEQKFKHAKDNGYSMVVYFNNDSTSKHLTAFSVLKCISEQRMGIHSLCLDFSKAHQLYERQIGFFQYMANTAMKVNSKLGNTNHTVDIAATVKSQYVNKFNATTRRAELDLIILGADVTHTQRESAIDMPSLAAVVGSVDGTFGKFLGSMRHQSRDTEVSIDYTQPS